jgi:acetylornithine deacetylase
MTLAAREVLDLHRRLTAISSVSGAEGEAAEFMADWLRSHGAAPRRLGATVLCVRAGEGRAPLLLLDSHLDTVPAGPGWTRDPRRAEVVDGRVYGLGANDAKASVAAMAAAFVDSLASPPAFPLALALVEQEETRGAGTEKALAALEEAGTPAAAAVLGEPTGLDVAVAQKGLLVLELVARGDGCHAAHAAALGARNAARVLAADLVALGEVDLGPRHELLGTTTLEPTVLRAGEARNVLPAEASAVLDVRTTPAVEPREIARRVAVRVASEVRVLSERLRPREIDPAHPLVRAARAARPGARLYGSATVSDWAQLAVPAIKCGPGSSERSHRPDEWVGEEEVLDGARFYRDLLGALAREGAA